MQTYGIRPWLQKQMAKGRLHVTRDELIAAFPDTSIAALSQAISRAVSDRIIAIAWKGFYLLLPPSYASRGTLPPSLYIDALMKYLEKPYCVGLLNAAEVYGAAHQRPMQYAVITSNPPPRARTQGSTQLVFVAKREFNAGVPAEFVRKIKVQTGYISVTTPEVTAISLVQYCKSAGGLSHVVTVLEELLEECRFELLPAAVIRYFPMSCIQRLGYIAECVLYNKSQAANIHEYLNKNGTKRRQPTPLGVGVPIREDCILNKKWAVYINTELNSDFDDT